MDPRIVIGMFICTESEALMTQEIGDRLQSCLPEWCTVVCTCADSTLDDICDRLRTGIVTLEELKKITEKRDQLQALCSAHINRKDKQYTQKTAALKQILQQRIKEQQRFTRTRELLGFLCGRISVKVLGRLIVENIIWKCIKFITVSL